MFVVALTVVRGAGGGSTEPAGEPENSGAVPTERADACGPSRGGCAITRNMYSEDNKIFLLIILMLVYNVKKYLFLKMVTSLNFSAE